MGDSEGIVVLAANLWPNIDDLHTLHRKFPPGDTLLASMRELISSEVSVKGQLVSSLQEPLVANLW
jgi:hypothetical protein